MGPVITAEQDADVDMFEKKTAAVQKQFGYAQVYHQSVALPVSQQLPIDQPAQPDQQLKTGRYRIHVNKVSVKNVRYTNFKNPFRMKTVYWS